MQKSIHFETPVTSSLAIRIVLLALEQAQKTYKEEYKSFNFYEDNEIDLVEKKIHVIIGDSRPHLGAFEVIIKLRIRMVSKGLPMVMEIVPSMRICIDDENPKEGQDNSVMGCIEERIINMIKFVGMACDNV